MMGVIEHDGQPIEKLGPYRIVREIGHGGMGTVYEAVDERSSGTVAVKVLPPELARQRSFLNRFAHELEALGKLSHPHVVPILDVGEDDALHYFAMEHVAGGSLEQLLSRDARLSVERACEIGSQVAHALSHAHAHGIVHRDVKPANILLTAEGLAKLTDFGIAKMADATQLTLTGAVVGTADYLSPEQAEGRRVTPRSDLYSLGIMLYRMLSGRAPFSGRTTVEIVQKHRFARPTALYELRPGLPSRLYELVDELIRKDASTRPPNGRVVAERLDRVLSRLRGDADGDPWAKRMRERAAAQAADQRRAAIRVACHVAGALIVIAGAWWVSLPPTPEEVWREVGERLERLEAGDKKWAMGGAYRVSRSRGAASPGPEARKLYERLAEELLTEARVDILAGEDRTRQVRAVLAARRGGGVAADTYEDAGQEAIEAANELAEVENIADAVEAYGAIAVIFAEKAPNVAKAARAKADALAASAASRPTTKREDRKP